MTGKFENIQALRGIAVVAVVLAHSMGLERDFFPTPHILPSLLGLGCSSVDLFFVISGFVMFFINRNNFEDYRACGRFIYNRASRVYPVYWIFTILLLICHQFILHKPVNLTSAYIWKSLLLLPQNGIPFLGPAWTLVHEMYFYIVITFFLLFPEKKILKFFTGWTLLIVMGNIFFHYNPKCLTASLAIVFNPLTFEFIGGCLIGYLVCKNIKFNTYLLGVIAFLLFLVGCIVCYKYVSDPTPGIIAFEWRRFFCFGIPSFFILYAIVLFENEHKIMPLFLRNIGDWSYSIYLSHVLVLSAAVKLFEKLHTQNIYLHCCFIIFAFIATLVVGKYSYQFLEKPILDFTRKGWYSIVSPRTRRVAGSSTE